MKKIFSVVLILFLLHSIEANAAKRYWVAGAHAKWNNTANWSATSGGTSGASVPGSNDTAYFNSGGNFNDTFDINVSVKRLEIASSYTATIVQGAKTLTIGTTGAVLSGGTFSGGSASITSTGAITISGTAFTSTSGTFSTNSNFTLSGTGSFTHNSGTFTSTATSTIAGTITFDKLTFSASATATYTVSNTLTVSSTLTLSGSQVMTFSGGTINAQGDITLSNSANSASAGGTTTINVNGTSGQTITGNSTKGDSRLPNLTINKSGGTLTLASIITVQGNFTYTAGTISPGSSTIHFAGTKTISGSVALNTVSFGSNSNPTYTISSGTTIRAKGNLETQGSGNITINTGNINVAGDVSNAHTGTSGGGSATITLDSTLNQTYTGSGTAGQGRLPNITINKTGGTLTLASIISVEGNWIYTQGTVSSGTSSVVLYGTYNLDGRASVSPYPTMQFYRLQVAGGSRTLTGDVNCRDNFAFLTGTTLTASTYDITVGGNWNGQGTWSHGNDTITFNGSNYNKIQGPSGGTVNFAHTVFDRRAGSVTLSNPVTIDSSVTLRMGRIKTTTTNYLQFNDNARCIMDNDDSAYVHGPVRKVGNDAFSFPLGDTTLHDSVAYHPLGITAPSDVSHRFEAQYYALGQTVGDSLVDSLADISDDEYWRLDRQVGSSNIIVTLSWNRNSGNVQDYNTLRIANWNNVKWLDLGGASINVTGSGTGSVTAVTVPTYVSNSALLTLANGVSAQPYAVLHRKLDGGYYLVRNGALYFMYDEEYNDTDNELDFTIYDEQRRVVASSSGTYAIAKLSDYGDNRFFIDLFDCGTNSGGSVGSGVYILEVTNEKNEKWMLRFKHVTTITPNCSGGGSGE